jgi:beta-glucosidase/6-phospho-beta-glucosidase/beta-galactosidase
MTDCADVIGYLHWSFMDNYEWQEAYCGNKEMEVNVGSKTGKRTRYQKNRDNRRTMTRA